MTVNDAVRRLVGVLAAIERSKVKLPAAIDKEVNELLAELRDEWLKSGDDR